MILLVAPLREHTIKSAFDSIASSWSFPRTRCGAPCEDGESMRGSFTNLRGRFKNQGVLKPITSWKLVLHCCKLEACATMHPHLSAADETSLIPNFEWREFRQVAPDSHEHSPRARRLCERYVSFWFPAFPGRAPNRSFWSPPWRWLVSHFSVKNFTLPDIEAKTGGPADIQSEIA